MNDTQAQVPLWQQLQATAQLVQAVLGGQSTTRLLPQVPPRLRPGVQALGFSVLRQLGQAQALRQQLARRAPPPAADALLCCALALASSEAPSYEPHVLVDQAVEAAKRSKATQAQASFINACLRRFLREADALRAAVAQEPVAQWNHPAWWIKLLRQDHPAHWQAMLSAANHQAPMSLRVNLRRTTLADYLALLAQAGIAADCCPTWAGEQAVLLRQPLAVEAVPGFAQGLVSVQDASAQIAAPLLLDGWTGAPPQRILDACAAPGGKTAHLLERCDAEVLALDLDPQRCERIHDNLRRLGLNARVVAANAAEVTRWWDGLPFDAILLDAPCTASGIVRRHPDVRWLRRASDVAQLAAVQRQLLASLWPLLRPGGRLLYCTCSVFRAEGQNQLETFLAHNNDARLLPSPGHLHPGPDRISAALPDNQGRDGDGFFYALLEKTAP